VARLTPALFATFTKVPFLGIGGDNLLQSAVAVEQKLHELIAS
jgi:hypothetical protein